MRAKLNNCLEIMASLCSNRNDFENITRERKSCPLCADKVREGNFVKIFKKF